jgi:hypothetical protein
MKTNNFILIFMLISIVTLIGCSQKGTMELNNLKNDTIIFGKIKWTTPGPSTIILNLKGYADDTCYLDGYLILPKIKVDTTFSIERYDPKKFGISYKKYKSKNTSLKIDYLIPGYFF